MIRELTQNGGQSTTRRTAAVLFAVFLQLALLPCSMAFEVVEPAHDCCPPEIDLNPLDCCEIDDASVDTRGSTAERDTGTAIASAPTPAEPGLAPARHYCATTGPPGPSPRAVPLHKLNCVYLK